MTTITERQRKAILHELGRAGIEDDEFTPWLEQLTGKRGLDALAYTDAARVLAALNERAQRRRAGEG